MNEDKIQSYAFSMLVIQLSFVLLGFTGVFPFSLEVAGLDIAGDIQDTSNTIQTTYENIASEGIINSIAITGLILIMGAKILLEFMLLAITGSYPLMVALGLPSVFALPISVLFSAVIIYMISIKFLGR